MANTERVVTVKVSADVSDYLKAMRKVRRATSWARPGWYIVASAFILGMLASTTTQMVTIALTR